MVEIRGESSRPDTFAETMAVEIRGHAHVLAGRWLDRLLSLIPVSPNEVFPTESILDHVPALIDHIADDLAASEDNIANSFMVSKARELGALRYEQDASVHQLLREYELLRSILETFVMERALSLQLTPDLLSVFGCVRRLNQTVAILTQTTVDTFVKQYSTTIAQQQRRLEQFNRMVGHELRQPLAALEGAVGLLRLETDAAVGDKALAVIHRNVERLADLTRTISRLSGMMVAEDRQPSIQRVSVTTIARDAARQLRETADARGVVVRVADDLGEIAVDVGQLELVLVNLLSNAIKYCDRAKAERFVAVDAVPSTDGQFTFRVRDNGIGMDATQLTHVFTPFYRGHVERDGELGIDGFGLGMAIVRDCLASLNGRIEIESTPGAGTTFTVTLPATQ